MLTREEAKRIADSEREYGPADTCTEYADAYVFSGSKDPVRLGGKGSTIVVRKADGKLYGLTAYYSMHGWEPGESKTYQV